MQLILMNHGLPYYGTKPELIIRMHEYKQANPNLRYPQRASEPQPAAEPQPVAAVEILDSVEMLDAEPDKWFLDDDDSNMLPQSFYWPAEVKRLTHLQIDEANLMFA